MIDLIMNPVRAIENIIGKIIRTKSYQYHIPHGELELRMILTDRVHIYLFDNLNDEYIYGDDGEKVELEKDEIQSIVLSSN